MYFTREKQEQICYANRPSFSWEEEQARFPGAIFPWFPTHFSSQKQILSNRRLQRWRTELLAQVAQVTAKRIDQQRNLSPVIDKNGSSAANKQLLIRKQVLRRTEHRFNKE